MSSPQWSAEERAVVDREIGAIVRKVNGLPGTYFGYEGNPALRADTWSAAFLKRRLIDSAMAWLQG